MDFLNAYRVCFFGHSHCDDHSGISRVLDRLIPELIRTHEAVEFTVGRKGDFDQLAASAVRKAKREVRDDNSVFTLFLPYETSELRHNYAAFEEYYDSVRVYDNRENAHYKLLYQLRNRTMADEADLVIAYVTHDSGGAYQALRYAEKQGKRIINIYELLNSEDF